MTISADRLYSGIRAWFAVLTAILLGTLSARAELQFDVFLGYENTVREGGWFPVVVEVHNDGPSFDAVVELSAAYMSSGQVRRVPVELPTNTRKRFSIPVFASAGRMSAWNVRLLDSKGAMRAEKTGLRPKDVAWETTLLGALPRTFTTAPGFPSELAAPQPEYLPQVARFSSDLFPDNAPALSGLSAIYLNSERALELKNPQQAALLAWVHSGGHLIVAVEQPGDVNALLWLKQLLPGQVSGAATVRHTGELDQWVLGLRPTDPSIKTGAVGENSGAGPNPRRNRRRPGPAVSAAPAVSSAEAVLGPGPAITSDESLKGAPISIASYTPVDGHTVLEVGGAPLLTVARRGLGQVSLLLASPEREPLKSWKNRPWFWAKLVCRDAEISSRTQANYGGRSMDAIFGAMIDSRQARKLPVSWLLAILAVYLVVIGPFDHLLLKRLNRQMLTWVTFPAYVALFSFLIYYIGYKLRAGEAEWNELNIVDLLPRGEKAEWRGWTFGSIYSPANREYAIASDQPQSAMRVEYGGVFAGSQDGARMRLEHKGKGYETSVFVPVWSSQLLVAEWMQPGEAALGLTPLRNADAVQGFEVVNHLPRTLQGVRIVFADRIYSPGTLPPSSTNRFQLQQLASEPLEAFVNTHAAEFQSRVDARQHALGNAENGRINNLVDAASATCFLSALRPQAGIERTFLQPAGFDLSRAVVRGDAVLLAWDAGQGAGAALNRFAAPRTTRNTLLRLAVPVAPAKPLSL